MRGKMEGWKVRRKEENKRGKEGEIERWRKGKGRKQGEKEGKRKGRKKGITGGREFG